MRNLFRRIGVFLVAMTLAACSQVDTGNVGVAKFGGKTNMEELAAGWSWTGLSSVDEFTTKEVALVFDNAPSKSQDGLTMNEVDVDIYFKAAPNKVAETVVKYQGDVLKHGDIVKDSKSPSDLVAGPSRVIRESREAIRAGVAKFPATDMHTKTKEVADAIQQILQSELNKSDPGTWEITGVNVRKLVADPALEASVRKKLETDQEIARKNKEADLARAEAARREVEARGEAKANEIIAASLTPTLIRLKELEAQKAFATQGTHTVLMGGGGAQPMFNVGK